MNLTRWNQWRSPRLLVALLLLAPLPSGAEEAKPRLDAGRLGYHPFLLSREGRPEKGALNALTKALKPEVRGSRAQIVVLLHGFDTPLDQGAKQYTEISRTLRAQSEAVGLRTAVVGLHWDSDAGALREWLLKALGHRLTSLLGFKNAIRNPYLEAEKVARVTGRRGLRSLLFGLQDRFPGTPIHIYAHSLGAQVVVTALAPEAERDAGGEPAVEQPKRELKVGIVTLAGADLDQDAFARDTVSQVRMALRRARVWWVTVPDGKTADGILELRRGAGKPDAVGNRGLKLTREELEYLLSQRSLVIDREGIPIGHLITDYYNERRLESLARTMLYLEDPRAPAARQSVLARLEEVMDAAPGMLERFTEQPESCAGLYAAWRINPNAREFGGLYVREEPKERVLGTRQQLRKRRTRERAAPEVPGPVFP